jgi:hypothetical protein
VAENRLLEPAQGCARLEPELLHQEVSSLAIDLERFRLPAGAVEGEHELAAHALVEGMLDDEALELGNERRVLAEREPGVDQLFLGDDSQLFEAGSLEENEGLEGEIGERRPAPERERLAEPLDALRGVGFASCLLEQTLEAKQVDLVSLDLEQVARGLRAHDRLTEQLPQRRDDVLERPFPRRRRSLSPEVFE